MKLSPMLLVKDDYEFLASGMADLRKMLQNLLATTGFDPAENEPLSVWGSLAYVIRKLNLSVSKLT